MLMHDNELEWFKNYLFNRSASIEHVIPEESHPNRNPSWFVSNWTTIISDSFSMILLMWLRAQIVSSMRTEQFYLSMIRFWVSLTRTYDDIDD